MSKLGLNLNYLLLYYCNVISLKKLLPTIFSRLGPVPGPVIFLVPALVPFPVPVKISGSVAQCPLTDPMTLM